MLSPLFWLVLFLVFVALFGIMHIIQYKLSSSSEDGRSWFSGFLRSKYFSNWIEEILIILLGCVITFVPSQIIQEIETKNELIKTLNSCIVDIGHEYNLNLNFIYEAGNPTSKEDIKNGEDYFISDLLKKEVIINNIPEDIRGYLYEEGQKIRINCNSLQKEQDEDNMRELVKKINSSYDNITYLLKLAINHQQKEIADFDVLEEYLKYLNSQKQDTVADAGYRLSLRVRLDGDESWKTSVNAQTGDIVEFLAEYRNISDSTQKDVIIKNIPPENLEIISGSTTLSNSDYPSGKALNSDAISLQPFNIGTYLPGSTAYVTFKAKVVNVSLQPGSNTLVNWTQCGVEDVIIQDYACVVLNYNGEAY